MMSFQPAALIGDERRWPKGHHGLGIDEVWARLEAGLGQRLPWEALQFGDRRCNRTAFGAMVGSRWVPLLDPASPADLAVRDLFLRHYGALDLDASHPGRTAATLMRAVARRPWDLLPALGWVARAVRRAGGPARLVRRLTAAGSSSMTFVVHAFMDADLVTSAVAPPPRGRPSDGSGRTRGAGTPRGLQLPHGASGHRRTGAGLRAAQRAGRVGEPPAGGAAADADGAARRLTDPGEALPHRDWRSRRSGVRRISVHPRNRR